MAFDESLNQRSFGWGHCQRSTTSSESSLHRSAWVCLLQSICGAEVGFLAARVPQTWVTQIKGYRLLGWTISLPPSSLCLGDKRQKSPKKEETGACRKSSEKAHGDNGLWQGGGRGHLGRHCPGRAAPSQLAGSASAYHLWENLFLVTIPLVMVGGWHTFMRSTSSRTHKQGYKGRATCEESLHRSEEHIAELLG